jgi:tRNA A37 methylthiotransferase MiaB
MEDTVPQAEKMRRLRAVEALQERIATELNSAFLGRTEEVLVEGAKDTDDGDTVYTGRNRANKLVHFRSDGQPSVVSIGDLSPVEITKTTPWSLQGEAAAVPATV